jgi:hypothetical protein
LSLSSVIVDPLLSVAPEENITGPSMGENPAPAGPADEFGNRIGPEPAG